MKPSRVSIVIPTHNRPDYVKSALRCACAQTWRDTEVILVDDGSAVPAIERIGEAFPEVKVVRHEQSKGPGAARNTGVSACSGDYILFADDDDLLHPDHVEALVRAAADVGGDTVVSGRWRKFATFDGEIWFGRVMCAEPGFDEVSFLLSLMGARSDALICSPSALWPHRIVEAVGWDEELFTNGDIDFFARAVLGGVRIVGRPVGMAYYRQHGDVRVAGTVSRRSLESATRFRLKWAETVGRHPARAELAEAVRDELMGAMIAWGRMDRRASRLDDLRSVYRAWGGEGYYLPNPPRGVVKNCVASAALAIGGPRLVGPVLTLSDKMRRRVGTPTGGECCMLDPLDAEIVATFDAAPAAAAGGA